MKLNQGENALLGHIRQARESRSTTTPRAEELSVRLDGAYKIQAALGKGRTLKGYKLGLISTAKQIQMGIDSPIYGRVYPEMLLENPVRLSEIVQPRLEPELAVVLNADLPPASSPGAARLAAGGIFLAIDLLSSIWEGYKFSIADVVADNTSGGGFLLGDRLLNEPLEGDLRLYQDGKMLTEGPVEDLGNIEEALVWLSETVGGLKSGQVIFLGSPAAALEARPGTIELHGPQDSVLIACLEE